MPVAGADVNEEPLDLILSNGTWLNRPNLYEITNASIEITTEPYTDLWQKTYYGFVRNNAPAYLFHTEKNFSFNVKVTFEYIEQFDQTGLIIYIDSNNWFKASIEYENSDYSRLGSVVTNSGYSDWATTDISMQTFIWYRLSRRGSDFLIEHSIDGQNFKQMRIFHLEKLGETTPEMGVANPPIQTNLPIQFGVYACSPSNSSFKAHFSELKLEQCRWMAHPGIQL